MQVLWEERIRSDVTPFVDPGTLLSIERSGSVLDAKWTQRRKVIEAQFILRDADGVFVRYKERELSYRAFFASEDMADITGIAKTSFDLLCAGIFVDTKASLEEGEGPAVDLITKLVTRPAEDDEFTTFVMVTGEAGAGKTSVLKELVRRQSFAYLNGSSDFVYLYVNAQGRALARFNEALATELNELRVALPHHAVAPLVKLGLIVPVIDGFDELLGVGGYDDAFSSISSFVQDLDGRGAIVASARSTYYEQEFLSRTSRSSKQSFGAWKVASVNVIGWGEDERSSYVRLKSDALGVDYAGIVSSLNKVFSGENGPLSSKPLFVARATDFLLRGLLKAEDGALLERLIDAFVVREQQEKLLRKSGDPILEAASIKSLCGDLAEEMWNLSSRELDRPTVRDLAEIAMLDLSIQSSEKSIVIERMPNLAFLQPGESTGSVAFEHEIFFDYFLASRIAVAIVSGSPSLALLLGRSAMPESLAESIAAELIKSKRTVIDICGALSSSATKLAPRQQLVKENAGRIVGALLRAVKDEVKGVSIEGLVFPGAKLHGVRLSDSSLKDCVFRRCDFTASILSDCKAEAVTFELCLFDRNSRLDLLGVDPSSFLGLRLAGDNEARTLYEPRACMELLRELGLPSAQNAGTDVVRRVDESVIELIDRLARAYAKCNPICVQDDYLEGIFSNKNWQAVQRIGQDAGVLRAEVRAANGPRRDFIRRLVRPEDLAAGVFLEADVPGSVLQFWAALEQEFPS